MINENPQPFIDYVVNPFNGKLIGGDNVQTPNLEELIAMDTIVLPLFPVYADTADMGEGIPPIAMAANSYNIIFCGTSGSFPEYEGRSLAPRLTIFDSLGTVGGESGTSVSFSGVIDEISHTAIERDKYKLSKASMYHPARLRSEILNNNDLLGNMPGAIWFSSQWFDNTIDPVTQEPVPRYYVKIEGAHFYMTTSDISAMLRWNFSIVKSAINKPAGRIPISGREDSTLAKYYLNERTYFNGETTVKTTSGAATLRSMHPRKQDDVVPLTYTTVTPGPSEGLKILRLDSSGRLPKGCPQCSKYTFTSILTIGQSPQSSYTITGEIAPDPTSDNPAAHNEDGLSRWDTDSNEASNYQNDSHVNYLNENSLFIIKPAITQIGGITRNYMDILSNCTITDIVTTFVSGAVRFSMTVSTIDGWAKLISILGGGPGSSYSLVFEVIIL